MSDLNPRQEKFVTEYLKTLNLTQSAIAHRVLIPKVIDYLRMKR